MATKSISLSAAKATATLTTPAALVPIEAACRVFAEKHTTVRGLVADLMHEIEGVKRTRMRSLRNAVDAAATAQATVHALVKAAPAAFEQPKTVVLHGVKVGYAKGRGSVEMEDEANTVALIRKKLPDLSDTLILTTEKVSKTAVANLSVVQLKSIGAQAVASSDEVVVRPVEGDIDKVVAAIFRGIEANAAGAAETA